MTDDRNDGPAMTEARLRDIIASYGASPQRWPADERVQALALLARSEAVQTHYDAAVRLDADLALLHPPAPSEALAERLADLIPATAAHTTKSGKHRPNVWRPAAIAASLLIAFALGLLLPSPLREQPMTSPDRTAATDVRPNDADFATLADLAIIDLTDDDVAVTSVGEDDLEPTPATEQLAAIPLD